MKKLIYQGSVKNIFESGHKFEFEFTDQYSIFDWGKMPDTIPNKGKMLAKTSENLFKILSLPSSFQNISKPSFLPLNTFQKLKDSLAYKELVRDGARTHFIEFIPPQSILVEPVEILSPTLDSNIYNYDAYKKNPKNTLIPLEVVFRFGVPEGSSFLARNRNISPGEMFDYIHIDFYTKLEPQDRLLSSAEAKELADLSDYELNDLITRTKLYAIILDNTFSKSKLKLWDGKFEFAFGKSTKAGREIILVDSLGPDELRLTKNGYSLSKEYLRSVYKDSTWHEELAKMKKKHPQNFKNNVSQSPLGLSQSDLFISKMIYERVYNATKEEKLSTEQNILIFGSGAREHALASHLEQDSIIKNIFVIPGNPGMISKKIQTLNIPFDQYLQFSHIAKIDYAIIGPETLLEQGLSDHLESGGIGCASPSKATSILESSKAFSKDFMQKYSIPTASYKVFSNKKAALNYVDTHNNHSFVVKLSALAAGKGVIICHSKEETKKAIEELSPHNETILIEELLVGKEISYFALCLEETYKVLGTACDYKRLNDKDKGPNTGGMGCYSPANWPSKELPLRIENEILIPTLKAMSEEGLSFKGTLFIGLMITKQGPKVLEYNVRFGDPETQSLLPRLKSNLNTILYSIAHNDHRSLEACSIDYNTKTSVHIVKAAKGYPGTRGRIIEKNQKINDSKLSKETYLYFAGVRKENEDLLSSGGRVLGITSLGNDLKEARTMAYKHAEHTHFKGEHYRKDIGL